MATPYHMEEKIYFQLLCLDFQSVRSVMATILDSTAAFSARAVEHGLTQTQLQRLNGNGITSLSQLAFALTTPGTSPADDALRGLLHDDPDQVTVGQLASIRRLMFDAQTLSAAQVKHVLSGSEAAKKAELVPAERAQRIQDQKVRLAGMELSGPYECSHSSYDYVAKMLEQDVPSYLEPHRFTTRSSEVAKEKPGKELVLDQTHLTVRDVERKDKCPMTNELQIFQALTRRALACDLMGVATFKCMERWHRFLMLLRLLDIGLQLWSKHFVQTERVGSALQRRLILSSDSQTGSSLWMRPSIPSEQIQALSSI